MTSSVLNRTVFLFKEVPISSRRGTEAVAQSNVSELSSLAETAHLLRSPKNSERLLAAMERSKAGTVEPQTVEQLRGEFGLEPEA